MSRKKGTHIFGMTGAQLATLMILSLIAIAIIFGGFIYIGSSSRPGAASSPSTSEPASSNLSDSTPDLTDITGMSLTATLDPSQVQIPSDWKPYGNSRIELRVSPQFNPADPETERQARIDFLREQGAVTLAQQLENEIFEYRFWFNFAQPETVQFVTSIAVKADFLPTETLGEYVDQAYGEDMQGFGVIDRQDYPIEGLEAQRILLTAKLNDDLSISVADYVITDGVNLWIISCWSDFNEIYTWLPEFDRVARSFHLLQ